MNREPDGVGGAPSRKAAVLVLLSVLYVWPLAVPFPLLDPDEGLHAAITQEMLDRGDFVMPRFLGEPFLDKPVLFFWAQAASFRLLGHNEAAARLPGLVFGALGALTTGWMAATVLGTRAGWAAALLQMTMLVPMALMQVPVHDIAVVPFANAALVAFWRAARAARAGTSLAWSVGAGAALGLAILTKGLTGVALVGLAHATLLLLERRLTPIVVAGGVLALAIGVGIAAPWYMAMERLQPGYLHYYFVERHLFGFATETQRHANRPWTYYIPVVLAGGLPWTLYLPFARHRARPSPEPPLAGPRADARRLGWTWLLTGWVFLSIAGSKLFTYALPLFPAGALLAFVAWSSRESNPDAPDRSFDRVVFAHVAFCAMLLPIVLTAVPMIVGAAVPVWPWVAAAVAAAAWAWIGVLWRRGAHRTARAWAPLAAALVVATVLAGVMPVIGPLMSARDLAVALNRSDRLPPELWVLRQRLGSVVFYLSPTLRAQATPQRVVQVQVSDLRARSAPSGTRVAVARQDQPRVDPFVRPGASFEQAGRYRLYRAEDLGIRIR